MSRIAKPERTVLVVLDLQKGVLAEGCVDAEGVVARTAALVERARAAGVPLVWVQHEEEGGLERYSDAWQYDDALVPAEGEPRVFKAYGDSFVETDFAEVLERLGATRLVVAGAQTDFCIRSTTQRAAIEGFDVTLVGDAHTTVPTSYGGVEVPGEHIVAGTNAYFQWLDFPGQRFSVEPAASVALM